VLGALLIGTINWNLNCGNKLRETQRCTDFCRPFSPYCHPALPDKLKFEIHPSKKTAPGGAVFRIFA